MVSFSSMVEFLLAIPSLSFFFLPSVPIFSKKDSSFFFGVPTVEVFGEVAIFFSFLFMCKSKIKSLENYLGTLLMLLKYNLFFMFFKCRLLW